MCRRMNALGCPPTPEKLNEEILKEKRYPKFLNYQTKTFPSMNMVRKCQNSSRNFQFIANICLEMLNHGLAMRLEVVPLGHVIEHVHFIILL